MHGALIPHVGEDRNFPVFLCQVVKKQLQLSVSFDGIHVFEYSIHIRIFCQGGIMDMV